MTDPTAYLESWFASHCDGDWEHDTRVEISTLDNPGWFLSINLTATELEGVTLDYAVFRDEDPTWVHCWSDGQKFEAAAGPLGLGQAIDCFGAFSSDETMPGRGRIQQDAAKSQQSDVPAIHYGR